MKQINYKTAILFMAITSMGVANTVTIDDYKNHLIKYEGIKSVPYKCSAGHLTVGIGHKLNKGELVKAKYAAGEIDDMFNNDIKLALTTARNVFPTFDLQPKEVKLIIVSLSFNLGRNGVSKFIKFRQAIHVNDYKRAAHELRDSLWFKQVGNRGRKYVGILTQI